MQKKMEEVLAWLMSALFLYVSGGEVVKGDAISQASTREAWT